MTRSARGTRLVAWLALGCHVLVASGLPLPLGQAVPPSARIGGKDRSRPFPCMDKPCGCATAEQCFANCCCHTPAQRLAWARAHAVEPTVLAALERRVASSPAGSCCSSRSEPPPCCADDDEPTPDGDCPDVCRDVRSLAAEPARADGAATTAEERLDDPPRAVILRDKLACGGIVAGWLACGAALPPPPRVAVAAATDLPAACLVIADEVAASSRAEPSPRPPCAA